MKKAIFLSTAALLAMGAMASPLTPQQALERASRSIEGKRQLKAGSEPRLAFTAKDPSGEAAVYVFNNPGDGFMLLSGDDVAVPMLGYADEGSFDAANIPPQLQYWLDEYARQIEYAKSQDNTGLKYNEAELTFPSSWQPVAPMITTNWDQGEPFNNETPVINGSNTPTGCVATAMAQVMYYWRLPLKHGTGQVSYNYGGKTYTMTFDRQPELDWDNMLHNYVKGQYNTTQANAVSNLMKQCGYSVHMMYRQGGSGTQTELVVPALKEYFGYSKGITVEQRLGYTATDWNALCYSQLAIGPVIYAGSSPEGGHCFVMDGYDGDGYFHFNWGWGGMCNGYYILNALNPTQQGTGGYYGGYNFTQGIIAGVQPEGEAVSQPITMSLYGTVNVSNAASVLSFTYSNGNGVVKFGNDCYSSITPALGIEITKADGTGTPTYVAGTAGATFNTSFPPGTYTEFNNVVSRFRFDTSLPDGKYKVRLVCRNENTSGDSWHYLNIDPQNYDYAYVTKAGSSYTVENLEVKHYNITKAEITTPLYYDNPFILQLTIENPTDIEITQSVTPYFYKNGKANYSGENRLITLLPGQKSIESFSCTMELLSGAETPTTGNPVDFDLMLLNLNTLEEYGNYGTVTMKRSSNNVRLSGRGLTITNAEEQGMNEEVGYLYGLNNFKDINLEMTVSASGGFIATPITAIVYEYDPETRENGAQIFEKDFDSMVYLENGESQLITTTLHFNDFDPAKMYALYTFYLKGNIRTTLTSIRFAASSGVENIAAETENISIEYSDGTLNANSPEGVKLIEAFDAKGAKVSSVNGDSLSLSRLAPGLYIIRAVDNAGNSKTLKIVR